MCGSGLPRSPLRGQQSTLAFAGYGSSNQIEYERQESEPGLFHLALLLVLVLAALKPLPPPKARAQRIHAVNNWANITITWPSTNTTFVPQK